MLNTIEKLKATKREYTLSLRQEEGTAEARKVQSACSSSNITDKETNKTKQNKSQIQSLDNPKQHLPYIKIPRNNKWWVKEYRQHIRLVFTINWPYGFCIQICRSSWCQLLRHACIYLLRGIVWVFFRHVLHLNAPPLIIYICQAFIHKYGIQECMLLSQGYNLLISMSKNM